MGSNPHFDVLQIKHVSAFKFNNLKAERRLKKTIFWSKSLDFIHNCEKGNSFQGRGGSRIFSRGGGAWGWADFQKSFEHFVDIF